jgi:hypothetical protein
MNCINCQKPIEDEVRICEYCGAVVIRLPLDSSSNFTLKRVGPPGFVCFLLDSKYYSAPIFKEPDDKSQILYTLGKGEPILIISEQEKWLEVLLPGAEKGFIPKDTGKKLEISNEKITDPLGYYRFNPEYFEYSVNSYGVKNKTKFSGVHVFTLPDSSSQIITTLQPSQCVPIIEERENWFKVQFDEGVRGFVDKKYGTRTLRKESLPLPQPLDNKSASSVFGGIATLAGLLVLGAAVAGFNEGLKDIYSD